MSSHRAAYQMGTWTNFSNPYDAKTKKSVNDEHRSLLPKLMSQSTQIEFTELVKTYYQRYHGNLSLSKLSFDNEGFITTAMMIGSGGYVQMRCGPAEYNTEIFVQTQRNRKRWSLVDLMSIKSVRNWIHQNDPNPSKKPRLEAEIEYAFNILVNGLIGVEDFQWLYKDVTS